MLQGSFVALVTPFKHGEIDYIALEKLINWHLEEGTDGFVLLGTTGESAALASDEREALLRFAIKRINRKVPVIVGTGTNNLQHTISQTKQAKELGADYALVLVPYYIKPTQQGIFEFFSEVAAKTDIPIIMYNILGRTGVNMTAATTVRIAKANPSIIGIKEASNMIVQASEIVRDAPEGFVCLSGEDGINLPLMACGFKGTISVTANILPKLMHEHIQACLKGDYATALKQHQYLIKINQHLFIETSPIPVKEALHMMGLIENEFRIPMCPLQDSNREILKQTLREYKLI
ncbi:MAG TPA: 4-hydroxy-tetrahydrodipicolinate synthase [Candidatus Cloacimonadota bacterium]|nr:4-hydroxy-tetrahydrodipicolinate synthase [Candidatus Cloacimonadota bacterium]HQL15251.1 4-hydroxy-tetrahydrodipicolinate synthase [Candidatus Cloacimonadota bacterium]